MRELRPERRAVAGRHDRVRARLAVVHGELVLREDGVVLPVALTPRVPDVAAVVAHRRPGDLERRRLADECRARAAIDMVDPELGRAAQASGLRRDDVLAVGRELRRREEIVVPLRDLRRCPVLSSDSVQRLSPPLRSDTKTIFFPSGLKRGWTSIASPLVRRVAVPPVIGSV